MHDWFFPNIKTMCPGSGLWPTCDWDGREFSDTYHPKWFQLGGMPLAGGGGWRGVMDGVQGDQDFLHKLYAFKRNLDADFIPLFFQLSVFCFFFLLGHILGSWHSKRRYACQYRGAVSFLSEGDPTSLLYTAYGFHAAHRNTCFGMVFFFVCPL